jgi:hypothetical protein
VTEGKVLEVTGEDVDSLAAQIPPASTLEPGTCVVVRAKARGLLSKLLAPAIPAHALGSAVLARGYVDVRAAEDDAPGRPSVTALTSLTGPSEAP